MRGSDLFIKCLENEGVEFVFGLGGEENLHFLDSIRESKIKYIPVRHEQSAGFMAATYGRLTGKAGVALATLGPGATNLITSAAYAYLGGMPMLMITGQKPLRFRNQGHFQIIDVPGIMKPVTKNTTSIADLASIPYVVRRAFRSAVEEKPGPVHIELPKDLAAEETELDPMPIAQTRRPIAEEKAVKWAVEMIEQAKFPLLLIGAGANRKLTAKMLREFIDKTGIPFFNTQMGKGVVDESHPLFLGTAALSDNDYIHCAINKADLIINIGHDVMEKPAFIMKKDGAKVIHINFYPAQVDQVYFPNIEVIGDIANAIWQIGESIKVQKHWDFKYFMVVKEHLDRQIAEKENENKYPIIPQVIVSTLRKVMPKDGILALDNGMYKLWFARNYKTFEPNTLLVDNALATMGAGLPSAIAAKLIHPDKKVVAIVGDGGFMMNPGELETAIRLNLDLTIVVIRDDGLGMIKWEQEHKNFPSFGLDHSNPDFLKFAESFGAKGVRVEDYDNFMTILKKSIDSKGVTVIDLPVDYSENHKFFTEELNNKTCPAP